MMSNRIIHFDSIGGASGDMILASVIALGAPHKAIVSGIKTMGIGKFEISAKKAQDSYFAGLRVRVTVPDEGHPHRKLRDIDALLKKSKLPKSVQEMSIRVFTRLAEAEGRIHGISMQKVHFHEVGAMDSIIDIVGSCLGMHLLGATAVTFGPLPTGVGILQGSHGTMPNPGPATALLLKGEQLAITDEPFELVTPTAAAILTALKSPTSTTGLAVTSVAVATAFGHRKLKSRPNLLRATLVELPEISNLKFQISNPQDQCHVLECNLDDMTPEIIGYTTQLLMQQGALDVYTTAIQMKKQRPGTLLTVLCKPEDRLRMISILLSETTTFGIREHVTQRTMLDRRHETVKTPYGPIRIKIGSLSGQDLTHAPEYEDCAAAAKKHGVPIKSVYAVALRVYETN